MLEDQAEDNYLKEDHLDKNDLLYCFDVYLGLFAVIFVSLNYIQSFVWFLMKVKVCLIMDKFFSHFINLYLKI